jgi:hypothetical protein
MCLSAAEGDEIKSELLCQLSYAPAVRGSLPAASKRCRVGNNNAPLAGTLRCKQIFIVT